MESQFRQPKQVINVEVNKQSIARNFGIGDNEVCYAKPGQPLTGYKAIYDKATQRAYYLPTGLTGTVVSISIAGVLTHSAGTVDLGALAVTRGEFVTVPGSFALGATINVKNERLEYQGGLYRWDGVLPKVVASGSTPESAGGVGAGKWVGVGYAALSSLIISATGGVDINSAINDMATSAYSIKNRRLLGVANNKIRSGVAVKIVCVGDSITYGYDITSSDKLPPADGHATTRASVQYPSRMESRLNLLCKSPVTVANRGYSGDTAKQCYDRWTNNPLADVAHLMLGINDAGGRYDATFSEYGKYMEKLIRRYIDWGCGVVLHTSTAQTFNNLDAGGARFTQYVRSIADSYGCPVFESEGVHQYCRYAEVYSDSTHFNSAGYAKYGDAVASFILAGGWVRPVIGISATSMQQPGRATEGIGHFAKGGASLGTMESNSYVWNGQIGKLPANTDGIHSFSFYLDAEAANVFAVGILGGAIISLSDPIATVDGFTPVNKAVMKSYPQAISETTSYQVSSRPQGYKSWVGSLVGRGWKTIYFHQPASNTVDAYLNEIVIESCILDEAIQKNNGVVPAKKEVVVFSKPIASIDNPSNSLPPPEKMPTKVVIPMLKGLYRQSQQWPQFYDNTKMEISILTRLSGGGALYNGINKLVAYTTSINASMTFESVYKSNDNCLTPLDIKFGWADPETPEVINEGVYPTRGGRLLFIIISFPDAPAAYYSMEVECSALMNSAGNYMY